MEDEIDVIHEDLGRARRRLIDIERAPKDGRWTGDGTEWMDACANQRQRIRVLEAELREACAQQVAAAEGFSC